MELIIRNNYDELSCTAADMIIEEIKNNSAAVLGLATGDTPIGTYNKLIDAYKRGSVSFREVKSINLDEYVGLSGNDKESYRYFMNTHLFDHIDIDKANTYVPDGMAGDLSAECKRYDNLYAGIGPADVQLLGIGVNGHIGFNEPGDVLYSATHVVTLSESTREANRHNFASYESVPTKAITLGMAGIMRAKKIILLASGKAKHDAVQKAVFGSIDPHIPASFLQLHPNVTIVCDFDLSKIKE